MIPKNIISVDAAWDILDCAGFELSREAIRLGIDQGKLPFGLSYTCRGGGTVTKIYRKDLDDFIKAHSWHGEDVMA